MTGEQRERYSRQILFGGIGEAGQERLLSAHVAVVGCGALGTFQAAALVRAGVGRLTIVDRDYVETSNLQRQWLFEQEDAEQATPKAAAAERRLARINPGIAVRGMVADLTAENALELIGGADLILDGTDNFETRYLINDLAVSRGIPWIYGGAVGSYGIAMAVIPGRTACFRCVYPNPPGGAQPTCETAGVLNAVTSLVASLQVAAALRILAGAGEEIEARITTVDVWEGSIRQIGAPPRDAGCPACGQRRFEWLESRRRAPVTLCGRNAVQIHERAGNVDLAELAARLAPLGQVRASELALRFSAPPYELTVFPDGRAIVKGTGDAALARSLYAKYVGC